MGFPTLPAGVYAGVLEPAGGDPMSAWSLGHTAPGALGACRLLWSQLAWPPSRSALRSRSTRNGPAPAFSFSNGSIFPVTVVLEVRGFSITERGEVMDLPLDTSRIHVKLSAMSFRIPPRGTRTVFYEATGDSLPAWFNILSAMSGTRTESGLNVRILLPHVVYLNQKQPLRKTEVAIRGIEFDPRAGRRGSSSRTWAAAWGGSPADREQRPEHQSDPAAASPCFPGTGAGPK